MNKDKQVRNFYDEESAYEQSILETKALVEKVISIDINMLSEKIVKLAKEGEYKEFADILEAVIGKETNKFYYCTDEDEQKYHGLIVGNVYSKSVLSPELKNKNDKHEQLNLKARAFLAKPLLIMTRKLKEIFSVNLENNSDLILSADNNMITSYDLAYLDDLIKYLDLMCDDSGRLKILVAERDVFAVQKAKTEYQKKSPFIKWTLKVFNKENSTIDNMANKIKEKK